MRVGMRVTEPNPPPETWARTPPKPGVAGSSPVAPVGQNARKRGASDSRVHLEGGAAVATSANSEPLRRFRTSEKTVDTFVISAPGSTAQLAPASAADHDADAAAARQPDAGAPALADDVAAFDLAEYARLTRPSPHRFEARSRRACVTVFPFTFGTTQRAWVGGRTGDGNAGGGGGGGSAGVSQGGDPSVVAVHVTVPVVQGGGAESVTTIVP
jgi:hypothetical protein